MRTSTSSYPLRPAAPRTPHPVHPAVDKDCIVRPGWDRGGSDGRLGHSGELSAHAYVTDGRLSVTAAHSGAEKHMHPRCPAAHDLFDEMTQQDSVCSCCSCPINFTYSMFNVLYRPLVHFEHDPCLETMIILEFIMSNMINDNQDPTQMHYELGDPTCSSFEVGTTSNPNPSKKKKKPKRAAEHAARRRKRRRSNGSSRRPRHLKRLSLRRRGCKSHETRRCKDNVGRRKPLR